MPRDSNGNYALPAGNPVVSGTPIESAGWGNPTMEDLGAEIQNSLDRAGRGAMTDQLKLVAGTAGAPGLTWAVELTSGWFRSAANDFRFSIATAEILEVTTAHFQSNVRVRVERALPAYDLYETDAATDEKQYSLQGESGDLVLRTRDDTGSGGATAWKIVRTGTVVDEFEVNATLIDLNGVVEVNTLELGHASDTTLSRVSAGAIAVEGHDIPTVDQVFTISAAWVFSGTPQINAINLGNASDTTLTRASAGRLAVEGDEVVLESDHNLDSGTYTPTCTNGTRVSGNTEYVCRYIRIGSQVFVTGTIDVTTSSAGAADFTITLPIAMTSTTFQELAGVMNHSGTTGRGSGRIQGEPTGEEATFQFTSLAAEATAISFSFAYTI